MNSKEKKSKTGIVVDKTITSKGIKQKGKIKKERIEGLDQGFITKWVI